ncbi:MAG: hypothetical protein ACFFCW_07100, partial [Candidatus Hodarchaeota archaeon]
VNKIELTSGQSCTFTSNNTVIPPGIEVIQTKVTCPVGQQDKHRRISIFYSGFLQDCSKITKYVKDQISTEFTLIRPDAFAYPIFAQPNFNSIIRYYKSTKFLYEASISSPKGVPVIAPGKCSEHYENRECSVYSYMSTIPTYRIVIARGNYTKVQETGVTLYALNYSKEQNIKICSFLNDANDLYNGLLGKPVYGTTSTIIEIPSGYSSSMAPDAIIVEQHQLRNVKSHKYTFHEMAHFWAPMDAPPWICEGFAEFMSITAVARLESSKEAEKIIRNAETTYRTIIAEKPSLKGFRGGKETAYTGGMLFVKELCDCVGFSTLGTTMRKYALSDKPLTIQEFKKVAEETSGMDLSEFFDRFD